MRNPDHEKVNELLAKYFAADLHASLRDHVARVLDDAPGTLTEANIAIIGLASNNWDSLRTKRCLDQVPLVGDIVHIDPLDIKRVGLGLRAVLNQLPEQLQGILVSSLIVSSTYETLRYVPNSRLDIRSRAFTLAMAKGIWPTDPEYSSYLEQAEALDPKTDPARLIELVLGSGETAEIAAANTKLTADHIRQIHAIQPENTIALLASPNTPSELVDAVVTIECSPYESTVNASPKKLHELIYDLFEEGLRPDVLAEFTSNPNVATSTLIWLAQDVVGSPHFAACMPAICSHPNLPVNLANQYVHSFLAEPAQLDTAPLHYPDFVLGCGGHPHLDVDLKAELAFKFGWEALHHIALTDDVVANIPVEQIQQHIKRSNQDDLRIFERILECQDGYKPTLFEWQMLVTETPQGAAWATTSPHAPSGISTRYVAERFVKEQADLWVSHHKARTPIEFITSWKTLTKPEFRPFEMPQALSRKRIRNLGDIWFKPISHPDDINRLEPQYREIAQDARRANKFVVEAIQRGSHNEQIVLGLGVLVGASGQLTLESAYHFDRNGNAIATSAPVVNALKSLADTLTAEQNDYIQQPIKTGEIDTPGFHL